MPTPRIHEVSDEFARRNLFLWTALGTVSLARLIGRTIRSEARDRAASHRSQVPSTPEGNEALFAALGMIGLSQTLVAHWRASAPRARRPGHAARVVERPASLRALLE